MKEFIEKLDRYVKENDEINACLIMGSITDEKQKRCDKFSDVDLLIISENKNYYLNNYEWLQFYRKVALHFNDPISLGIGTELRVCFDNELLSDIAIVDYDEFKKPMNNEIFCTKIIGRGFNIIKSDYPNDIYKVDYSKIQPSNITEDFLNRLTDEFIIDVYNVLKYYKRSDYFTAFYAFERRISKILILLLEESYKLDSTKDVIFNGRYMKKWLSETDYQYVEQIFLNINCDSFMNSVKLAIELFELKISYLANFNNFTLENKMDSFEKIKRKMDNEE